jgi:uncharacterized membrane protein
MRRMLSRRWIWAVVAPLCALGIASGVLRAIDAAKELAAPTSHAKLGALDRRNAQMMAEAFRLEPASPRYAALVDELHAMTRKFREHPLITLLHVVAGALLLLVAPFQFSSRLRARRPGWHRGSGRVLLVLAVAAGLSGTFFGIVMPYGGWLETTASASFGALFLGAAARGYAAIRRGDIRCHREWMIRLFATAVAVAVMRAFGSIALLLPGTGPENISPGSAGLSLWLGWLITLGVAEAWIRRTRARADAPELVLV